MPVQVSELAPYDYALVRVVPSVVTGEFVNAGVVLFCRPRRFLAVHIALNERRLAAVAPPGFPVDDVAQHLALFTRICAGEGPIGALPQFERFHWLVAPKSTIIQTSPVHSGRCSDPAATLARLAQEIVRNE